MGQFLEFYSLQTWYGWIVILAQRIYFWQYPFLAPSVGSPQVCGRNEFEVCTTLALYTYQFIPYYGFMLIASVYNNTRAHILKPFEDCEPTGLKLVKVDI